jgi:ABC-type uncharacterized transport system involved in gliding motility auxiliary subunit
MKRSVEYLGIAGIVFITFGIITAFLVEYDWLYFVPTHLLTGTVLIILFLIGGGHSLFRKTTIKHVSRYSVRFISYCILFFIIIILVNYISYKKEFFRFDSTEQKVYSLAPQTVEVIKNLEEPITIRGFYLGGIPDYADEKLIGELAKNFPNKITWISIDPEKQPQLVSKFGISEARTLHFSFASESKSRAVKLTHDRSEQAIVNAIVNLTRSGRKIVYFLQGHGEPDLISSTPDGFSEFKNAVEDDYIEIRPLSILNNSSIPGDINALIIVGAKKPYLEHEIMAINEFLQNGGNALLLFDVQGTNDIPNLVKPLGVEIGRNVIVDNDETRFAGASLGVQPVIRNFLLHEITSKLSGAITLTVASSVRVSRVVQGVRSVELARTSPSSWAETNLELLFSDSPQAKFEDDDIAGPVSIAVAINSTEINQGVGRLVVIGDKDFVSNMYIGQLNNRDFMLNTLNWAIGEEQNLTIRARSLRQSTKEITNEQFNTIFLITAILIPEFLLLGGLFVWWRRRVQL